MEPKPTPTTDLKVGDRVEWHYFGKVGDTGTVTKVTPRKMAGGVRALVKVRWDKSGFEGSVEDRKLRKLKAAAEATLERLVRELKSGW
jgi:hypothetical protein